LDFQKWSAAICMNILVWICTCDLSLMRCPLDFQIKLITVWELLVLFDGQAGFVYIVCHFSIYWLKFDDYCQNFKVFDENMDLTLS